MRLNALVWALSACWVLNACVEHPTEPLTSAQIESVGILAIQAKKPEAIAQLSTWAKEGHVVAQRELGLALSLSTENWPQAVNWLQKAADGGDREAQFELANAYLYAKLGLRQDYKQAWLFYEKAAVQGEGKASFLLARMARHGWGVTENAELSAHWLLESSRQENAQAMYELSVAYAQGDGLPKDPVQARYWLNMSADYDYKIAMQALALELEGQSHQDSSAKQKSQILMKEAADHRLMNWNTNL